MLGKDGMYYDITFLPRRRIDESMIPFDFDNIITFAFAGLLDFVRYKKHFFTCLAIIQVCIHQISQNFITKYTTLGSVPFDFDHFLLMSLQIYGTLWVGKKHLFHVSDDNSRFHDKISQNFKTLCLIFAM